MTLKLTDYQARQLYFHLSALSDAGAETLTEKELAALDEIINKLRKGIA